MNDFTNMKNLLIGGLVVIIVGFVAFSYVSRDRVVSDETLVSVSTDGANSVDSSFIRALSSLRQLKLDDSVFARPSWGTLMDFGRTLEIQPYGRSNPFAPTSAVGNVTQAR